MLYAANNNTRTSKSAVNFATGIFSQLVTLVLNFLVRFIFIQKIGYEYLGINSLFTNILTILSVADLGFGSALGIVLYSSLSKKDETEIAGLMNFFRKLYFVIGLIVLGFGLALTPFVRFFVNTEQEIPHLSIFFLFFLLNSVSSYFVSYHAILIRADQKNLVVNNVTTLVKIGKALLEIFVLVVFIKFFSLMVTYISYLVVMVISTYAIGIITSIYAKKKYPYAFGNKVKISKEKKNDIISTTKDLFIYRVCSAFSSPIDSVLISILVSTVLLGIFSNYFLIFTTLLEFICLLSRNVISSVGNFVVEKPIEDQKKLYFELQIIYFAIILFCTINFVALASPFISLVFGKENSLSIWTVFLLGATLICRCAGELAIIFRETTRIYKKTKFISLFNVVIHVGLSLLLGKFIGLEGILLGGVIAYFATNFWFEIFALFKWHFKSSPIKVFLQFLYVILITAGLSAAAYFLCQNLYGDGGFAKFILCGLGSLAISLISLIVLYPVDGFNKLVERFKHVCILFFNKIKFIYENNKIQKGVIVGYIVLLTTLIILRDFNIVGINKFIYFGLLVFATLLLKKENGLWLILFTLPVSPSLAELYILLYALAYFVFVCFKNHSWKTWLLIGIVPATFLLLEIILGLFYGGPSFTVALRIFTLTGLLSVLYYDRHVFTKKHLMAFVLGCMFLFFILAINWVIPAIYGVTHKAKGSTWLSISVLVREVRLGYSVPDWITNNAHVEYTHVGSQFVRENPNNIGLLTAICFASLFAIRPSLKGKKKVLCILLMLMCALVGLWCRSRTFIILFALLLVLALFLPVIYKRRDVTTALLLFCIVNFTILIILASNSGLAQSLMKRFSEENTSTGGNRIIILKDYISFIFSDPRYILFGVSCSNLASYSQIGIVPHTNIVQLVASYGLFTAIGFIGLIVISLLQTKRVDLKTPKTYLILPIVFAFIFTFTLQLFAPSIILISFIPGVMCLSFLNKGIAPNKEIVYLRNKPLIFTKEDQLKLAMCATSFGGGIGSYIKNITPYLIDNKVSVSFVFNHDTTTEEINFYSKINCEKNEYIDKKSRFKPIHLYRKLRYYLQAFNQNEPDIIYINTSSYLRCFLLWFASIIYGKAHIIMHCHMPVNAKMRLPILEKLTRWFVTFTTYNEFACSFETGLIFFGKPFKKNPIVITNFINEEVYKFNEKDRKEIRKEFGIKDSELVLGNVGRLWPQKNQLFLIELLSQLSQNFKLVIVGSGSEKDKIESKINEFNLNDRVILVENTPIVYKYYSAFDYFVLPSTSEGLPFVSVEAQCSGLLNIVNVDLPHGVKISDNVIFMPLDINSWALFIKHAKPNEIELRKESYKDVIKAGFSINDAPFATVDKIRSVSYKKVPKRQKRKVDSLS